MFRFRSKILYLLEFFWTILILYLRVKEFWFLAKLFFIVILEQILILGFLLNLDYCEVIVEWKSPMFGSCVWLQIFAIGFVLADAWQLRFETRAEQQGFPAGLRQVRGWSSGTAVCPSLSRKWSSSDQCPSGLHHVWIVCSLQRNNWRRHIRQVAWQGRQTGAHHFQTVPTSLHVNHEERRNDHAGTHRRRNRGQRETHARSGISWRRLSSPYAEGFVHRYQPWNEKYRQENLSGQVTLLTASKFT